MLHMMASEVYNSKDEEFVINMVQLTCKRHPCSDCSSHCKEYLKSNDITKYKGIKDDKGNIIGLSKYLWEFHNAVNHRLGKSRMTWDTYYSIYYINKESTCNLECGTSTAMSKVMAGNIPFIKVEKK
jgi:hypothetical protein